jgi:hypothetical protein
VRTTKWADIKAKKIGAKKAAEIRAEVEREAAQMDHPKVVTKAEAALVERGFKRVNDPRGTRSERGTGQRNRLIRTRLRQARKALGMVQSALESGAMVPLRKYLRDAVHLLLKAQEYANAPHPLLAGVTFHSACMAMREDGIRTAVCGRERGHKGQHMYINLKTGQLEA